MQKDRDDFSHGRNRTLRYGGAAKHKNGAWVDVGIFAKAVERDEGDRATHIVGVMLDLSDRRILEAQLRQAQKMEAIGRLAGGVAHDLNNLLTAIFSFTDFVMDDMRPEDPAYKDLKEVEKAAKRAESLTRQLLAFSRKQISDPKSIQINTLVAEMDRMLRRILGEDIEFLTYFDEDLWNTKIDPGHLEQVIVNLAVNARDAMPTGGKITIETANVSLDETYALSHGASIPKGDYVMFAFSDSGEGMSLDVQRSIFEPFFTTKPVGKGTGLGLSTCYGIVKHARGYIWVYSELKKGTTFKVYLPRFDGDAASLEDSGRASTTHGTETILLAEDDEQVRALIVRTLARKGYKVIVAENGREASILAEKHKETIHLLITDVVMPGMSGRDLAERVSQIHQETRVLYISGYTQNAIVHHGVLEEGLILLQKPFTPDILASMVRRMLDTPNDCLVDGRRRILCVDDDARVLSAMQRSLKDDYEYVGANSGQAALELLRSSNFDLILCDINMPEMSGPQLHELVKQNNPEVASRFVFVTSAVGSEFVDSFMTQTPQPVLEKPLSSGQIKSLIAPQV
ncbi:MAG: response regulator [Myxococcota bacterium]